ncbi:hypothetical protein JCM12298_09170 [Desulfothermus naphthae]
MTMKQILVPIFSKEPNLWAAVHAMQLSERINAKVYLFEYVEEGEVSSIENSNVKRGSKAINLLNLSQKEGKNVHIRVKGNFLEKCTKFIREHGIDLLVLSIPNRASYKQWVLELLKTVKKQKLCSVEIVKK